MSLSILNLVRRASSTAYTKFRPLSDRVLVERLEAVTQTKAGIKLHVDPKARTLEGVVRAVGPGRIEDGKTLPINVKAGDRVVLPEYGGSKVTIDDQDYWVFRESDFLGVLQS